MNAKEYLEYIRSLETRLRMKEERIAQLQRKKTESHNSGETYVVFKHWTTPKIRLRAAVLWTCPIR